MVDLHVSAGRRSGGMPLLAGVLVAASAMCGLAGVCAGERSAATPSAAVAALPSGGAGEEPLAVATAHLRRSDDLLRTAAELDKRGDWRAVDCYYHACEESWNAIWTCPGSADVLCAASEKYAAALHGLLDSAACQGRLSGEGLVVGPRWRPLIVPIQTRALPVDACGIESILAACPPEDRRISQRKERGGFGLPVSVRLTRPAPGSPGHDLTPARQAIAATAVLRFGLPGRENFLQKFSGTLARDHAPAILDLANPVEIAAVHIGPARPFLAADLTTPLLDMLESLPKTGAVQGFIQPFGGGETRPRLELLHPHEPGKIPVVFIHGLASDEGTWFDLINELRGWPTFHRRFEPWVFNYPTGGSFLQMAATLRSRLTEAVRQLDPQGNDPALRALVLVGHSMGGLHAKLQVVDSAEAVWNSIACSPFDEIVMQPELRSRMAPNFFFRPLPFVKRVVFIATPHGGSPLASLGVGRAASLTVRQPPQTVAVHDAIMRANPGRFRPDYERRLPTTVDVLEPDSTILQAVHSLRPPCWVTTHSIIGDVHHGPTGRGDCIVPVASARLPGVVSELMVPARHTRVHHHPLAVAEIERILLEHLRETGLDRVGPVPVGTAAPAAHPATVASAGETVRDAAVAR